MRDRTARGAERHIERQDRWGTRVKGEVQWVYGKLGLPYLIHRELRLPAQVDLFVLGGVRRVAVTVEPCFEDLRGFLGKVPAAFPVESILIHAHRRLEGVVAVRRLRRCVVRILVAGVRRGWISRLRVSVVGVVRSVLRVSRRCGVRIRVVARPVLAIVTGVGRRWVNWCSSAQRASARWRAVMLVGSMAAMTVGNWRRLMAYVRGRRHRGSRLRCV